MAYLTINGKDYVARTDFKFERTANEKYNAEEDGQKIGGFVNLYLKLLQFESDAILGFWDCALSWLKKEKPSLDEIEDALYGRIEQDGDTDKLLKEAFGVLDDSGFFRKQVRSMWKELTKSQEAKENETPEQTAARKDQEALATMMADRRNELVQ